MSGIEIDISADGGVVKKTVEEISKAVDKANRIKWSPIDLKGLERDLKKAENMIREFQRRTGVNPGAGMGAPPVPGARPPPAPPSGPPDPGAAPGGNGGGRRSGRGGRRRYHYTPDVYDILANLTGGFGGGVGRIGGAGLRGAFSGGASGGAIGGGMGLLKGLGIGALAFGAFKVGQNVNEGYEMAKDRAITLDILKRQMGDVGKSFDVLKAASEAAGNATMLNSKEAAKLMGEFNRLGRGVDKTEETLMDSAITSGRTAGAYGLDPMQAAGFFGGVRHIDPKQNNRELALLLAETIGKSGMASRADEVMQAIQVFAAASARMSLSSPNLNAYAGAYGEMMSRKLPGLDGETTAGILSQANSSVMRMGGAGEAGQAFILAAMNRSGGINPIQAMALAQGGLFGTRRGVFAEGGSISEFMGDGRVRGMREGRGADVTNLDSIKAHLARMGGDKWFQLEGAQRLFGLSSLSQTAALMNLKGEQGGQLFKSLKGAGVDIQSLNESGIQTVAAIGGAKSKGELGSIFADMGRRTGKGALTEGERSTIDTASRGSLEDMRTAMIKVAASKDQEMTDAKTLIAGIASIESTQISIGDKLIPVANTMRDALVSIAGKGEYSLRKDAYRLNLDDARESADDRISQIRSDFAERRATATNLGSFGRGAVSSDIAARRSAMLSDIDAQESIAITGVRNDLKKRTDYLDQQERTAVAAGATTGTYDGSTPLPPGTGGKAAAKDQIEVNVNVKNQSVSSDGRVISETGASARVPVARGSGTKAVSIDAR